MREKLENQREHSREGPHFLITKSAKPTSYPWYPSTLLFLLRSVHLPFKGHPCTKATPPILSTLFLQLFPLSSSGAAPSLLDHFYLYTKGSSISHSQISLSLDPTLPLPHTYPHFCALYSGDFVRICLHMVSIQDPTGTVKSKAPINPTKLQSKSYGFWKSVAFYTLTPHSAKSHSLLGLLLFFPTSNGILLLLPLYLTLQLPLP